MIIPNIWNNKIHVPNHQPAINQLDMIGETVFGQETHIWCFVAMYWIHIHVSNILVSTQTCMATPTKTETIPACYR